MKKIFIFILIIGSFFFLTQSIQAFELKKENRSILDFIQILDNENEHGGGGGSFDDNTGGGADCNTMGEFNTWLKNAFRFVQYAGVALAVVLTGVDFLQVIGGSKDDDLSKAFSRAVKRLIAVVLLLLTTVIVTFLVENVINPVSDIEVPNCTK